MNGIATRDDVLAIEAMGLPPDLPTSTYEMICAGAAIDPSAPALSFFMTADAHRDAECWTYRELVGDITRTANMFARLGVIPLDHAHPAERLGQASGDLGINLGALAEDRTNNAEHLS